MPECPRFFRLRQVFPRPRVAEIAATVKHQLNGLLAGGRLRPGQTVAVTAGSRGIANIAEILRAAVGALQDHGARVFIVPAMGSHGGGTAEGQQEVLASYGITAATCGCEIRAGMETEVIGEADEGFPIHLDAHAHRADHILVCGRVKPHTRFTGPIESGLMKMLLIGLGKRAGAEIYHRAIHQFRFEQIVQSVGTAILASGRILGGLAIVENAYDETALIEAVAPEEFIDREPELLCLARQWMPRLPFDAADLVLIDLIGKDISGAGLDTNVVGRKYVDHAPAEQERPRVKYLAVRSLTPVTAGNATGIGLVEFCRSQVLEQMDRQATRINCLTGGHPTAAMLPLDFPTDAQMIAAAISVMGLTPATDVACLWIASTLDLEEVECSEYYWEAAQTRSDLEILTEPRILAWDAEGNLPWIRATASVPGTKLDRS